MEWWLARRRVVQSEDGRVSLEKNQGRGWKDMINTADLPLSHPHGKRLRAKVLPDSGVVLSCENGAKWIFVFLNLQSDRNAVTKCSPVPCWKSLFQHYYQLRLQEWEMSSLTEFCICSSQRVTTHLLIKNEPFDDDTKQPVCSTLSNGFDLLSPFTLSKVQKASFLAASCKQRAKYPVFIKLFFLNSSFRFLNYGTPRHP